MYTALSEASLARVKALGESLQTGKPTSAEDELQAGRFIHVVPLEQFPFGNHEVQKVDMKEDLAVEDLDEETGGNGEYI